MKSCRVFRALALGSFGFLVGVFSNGGALAKAVPEVNLARQELSLPAAPAALIPADLDGDGRKDLLVVTAGPAWGQISEERLEGAIQVLEVVPALFENRLLHSFLADPDGTLRLAAAPLKLPLGVHTLEPGPPGAPALAVTDEGVAAVRLKSKGEGKELVLETTFLDGTS